MYHIALINGVDGALLGGIFDKNHHVQLNVLVFYTAIHSSHTLSLSASSESPGTAGTPIIPPPTPTSTTSISSSVKDSIVIVVVMELVLMLRRRNRRRRGRVQRWGLSWIPSTHDLGGEGRVRHPA